MDITNYRNYFGREGIKKLWEETGSFMFIEKLAEDLTAIKQHSLGVLPIDLSPLVNFSLAASALVENTKSCIKLNEDIPSIFAEGTPQVLSLFTVCDATKLSIMIDKYYYDCIRHDEDYAKETAMMLHPYLATEFRLDKFTQGQMVSTEHQDHYFGDVYYQYWRVLKDFDSFEVSGDWRESGGSTLNDSEILSTDFGKSQVMLNVYLEHLTQSNLIEEVKFTEITPRQVSIDGN